MFLCLCLSTIHVHAARQQLADKHIITALKQAVMEEAGFQDRFQAQVWLMDMSNRLRRRLPDSHHRINLLQLIHREARRAGLQPELVLAVIQVESNFDRFAISSVGARGLMQVMPFWIRKIGRFEDNLFEPATNLRYGCTILKHYLKRENGNWTRALARYNGSLGSHKYPRRVFAIKRRFWYP